MQTIEDPMAPSVRQYTRNISVLLSLRRLAFIWCYGTLLYYNEALVNRVCALGPVMGGTQYPKQLIEDTD
jgi:hypothetical protein